MKTTAVNKPPARRLLLALDATLSCDEALASAARLADLMQAELHALFLEDTDLLALADLPCVVEVRSGPGVASRSLNRREEEQRLQQAALHARQTFERIVKGARLSGSFHAVQGRRQELLHTAREAGDLFWFNYRSSLNHYAGPAAAWLDTLYVLASPTPGGDHALQLAAQLIERGFQHLVLLQPEPQATPRLMTLATHPAARVIMLPPARATDPSCLLEVMENRSSHVLLLPDDCALSADRERLLETLVPLRTEVLLVH